MLFSQSILGSAGRVELGRANARAPRPPGACETPGVRVGGTQSGREGGEELERRMQAEGAHHGVSHVCLQP